MTIKTTINDLLVCLQKGNYKLCFYLDDKSDDQEILYCCKGKEIPFMKIFNAKANHLNEVIKYSTSYVNEIHDLSEQEKQNINDLINEWAKFDVDKARWQQIDYGNKDYYNTVLQLTYILLFIVALATLLI